MQSNQSQVSLPVLLNDTGRRLLIKLVDNGKPYYINDGCRAVFYAEKSDGNVLVNDCIIEKNAKIRYDFTAQTASAGGISKCEIRLYGANGRLITSPKFIMVIDSKVIYDDEVLASYSEFTTLDNIIASEQSRVEAEAERVKADAERARELDTRTEAAISAMMSSVPVIEAEKEGKTTTITVTTPEETKTVTVEDGEDGYTPVKGVDYFDGEDGYTPVKGVDYFDGEDGYTPVKGVDYFDGENAEGGDWDAAEGETGHILNRTHYKEETPAVVLYDGSSTFATELGSITGIDTTQITEGGTYAITWNGTVYKCVAVLSGSVMLGNLSLMSAGEDTGEPFCLEVLSDTSAYIYKNTSTAETVTIKVEIPSEVTYHKLDNNYLGLDWLPVRNNVVLLGETTVTSTWTKLSGGSIIGLDTVLVVFDGAEYSCEVVYKTAEELGEAADGYLVYGDSFVLQQLVGASVPTLITSPGTHTISILSPGGYNKLPKEYLPDDMGNLDEDAVKEIVAEYNAENPFTETDPTVPAWAKAATKPTYTAAEVGALPDTTAIPTVPTKVSAFTNDAGYLTAHQSLDGYATETYVDNAIEGIDVPSGVLVVTVTGGLNGGVTDHSADEIVECVKNGGTAVLRDGTVIYPLRNVYEDVNPAYAVFDSVSVSTKFVMYTAYQVSGNACGVLSQSTHLQQALTINGTKYDGSSPVTIDIEGGSSSETATMQTLTFTGAVEATYDGSESVSVEIPTDAHINELIDTKLGVIENGTY